MITAIGLAAGTGFAIAIGRVMTSALFGLVSLDVCDRGSWCCVSALTALAAALLPARRAADLDPTEALRIS